MSAAEAPLRIGDVAKLAGTTPRTIRYYEELGLLAGAPERPSGGHRLYSEAEVERLREVIRLKELLGVTLDELKDLLTAEEARAAVGRNYAATTCTPSAAESCWKRRSATWTASSSWSSTALRSFPSCAASWRIRATRCSAG